MDLYGDKAAIEVRVRVLGGSELGLSKHTIKREVVSYVMVDPQTDAKLTRDAGIPEIVIACRAVAEVAERALFGPDSEERVKGTAYIESSGDDYAHINHVIEVEGVDARLHGQFYRYKPGDRVKVDCTRLGGGIFWATVSDNGDVAFPQEFLLKKVTDEESRKQFISNFYNEGDIPPCPNCKRTYVPESEGKRVRDPEDEAMLRRWDTERLESLEKARQLDEQNDELCEALLRAWEEVKLLRRMCAFYVYCLIGKERSRMYDYGFSVFEKRWVPDDKGVDREIIVAVDPAGVEPVPFRWNTDPSTFAEEFGVIQESPIAHWDPKPPEQAAKAFFERSYMKPEAQTCVPHGEHECKICNELDKEDAMPEQPWAQDEEQMADDAIHARGIADLKKCGGSAKNHRVIPVDDYPDHDVDGSYCWTCLEIVIAEREALRSIPDMDERWQGYDRRVDHMSRVKLQDALKREARLRMVAESRRQPADAQLAATRDQLRKAIMKGCPGLSDETIANIIDKIMQFASVAGQTIDMQTKIVADFLERVRNSAPISNPDPATEEVLGKMCMVVQKYFPSSMPTLARRRRMCAELLLELHEIFKRIPDDAEDEVMTRAQANDNQCEEITRLKGKIADQAKTIDDLNAVISGKDRYIAHIRLQVDQALAQLRESYDRIGELGKRIDVLLKERNTARDTVDRGSALSINDFVQAYSLGWQQSMETREANYDPELFIRLLRMNFDALSNSPVDKPADTERKQ